MSHAENKANLQTPVLYLTTAFGVFDPKHPRGELRKDPMTNGQLSDTLWCRSRMGSRGVQSTSGALSLQSPLSSIRFSGQVKYQCPSSSVLQKRKLRLRETVACVFNEHPVPFCAIPLPSLLIKKQKEKLKIYHIGLYSRVICLLGKEGTASPVSAFQEIGKCQRNVSLPPMADSPFLLPSSIREPPLWSVL